MIWYKLAEKKPIPFISGCFDGLKSAKILAFTRTGRYEVVEMYENIKDGVKLQDFYNNDDVEINNILFWTEIDPPV